MAASNNKKRRPEPIQVPEHMSQTHMVYGILDCYDMIAKNEYSENTIGLQAFLTRKHVGNINFSDIIEECDKRSRTGQTPELVALLDDRRRNLPDIDASVEKCLMITRLISYIRENETNFNSLLSNVRVDMQIRMTDSQLPQNINHPADFRKREDDFSKRKLMQEKRRLFYYSNEEVGPVANLVHLQNRTTEQLNFTINQLMKNSKARDEWLPQLERIFRTSFLIVAQPHTDVNPTTIYEKKGPGQYTAKISVIIISLLHDYMQMNPSLIELFDIEPSLCPFSDYYKLEEPQSLSWRTCQLQVAPEGKARMFKFAELNCITVGQASKSDARVRFAQALHTFKFAIKLQLHLANIKLAPIYQISLESLPFAIGAHNSQLPQLLSRVILDDIRRFNKPGTIDVKVVHDCLQRYFIHRTGVRPNTCIIHFVEQELGKAYNQRSGSQAIEDIYLDFLVHFVHQVEFIAKHPLLAMFHVDGLFLGICSSERVAEAIIQTSGAGSPAIGLRFNSIRIDYTSSITTASANRAIKINPCAIRVDIYNDRTKRLQNRTFDSGSLASDISKFIVSAQPDNGSNIRILSNFDEKTNERPFTQFSTFAKYFNERLQAITKSDEKYKPVTDLVENANDGSSEVDDFFAANGMNQESFNLFSNGPNSIQSTASFTPASYENDQNADSSTNHEYATIPHTNNYNNVRSPSSAPSPAAPRAYAQPVSYVNQTEALQLLLLSKPELADEFRKFGIVNIGAPVGSPLPPQVPTPGQPSSQTSTQHQTQASLSHPKQQQPYQSSNMVQTPSNYPPIQVNYQPSPFQSNFPPASMAYIPQNPLMQSQQPPMIPPYQLQPHQLYSQQMPPQQYQQHQQLLYHQQSHPQLPYQPQQPYQHQYFQSPTNTYQQQPMPPSTVIHHYPAANNQSVSFSSQTPQYPSAVNTVHLSSQHTNQVQSFNGDNKNDSNLNTDSRLESSMNQDVSIPSNDFSDEALIKMLDDLPSGFLNSDDVTPLS